MAVSAFNDIPLTNNTSLDAAKHKLKSQTTRQTSSSTRKHPSAPPAIFPVHPHSPAHCKESCDNEQSLRQLSSHLLLHDTSAANATISELLLSNTEITQTALHLHRPPCLTLLL